MTTKTNHTNKNLLVKGLKKMILSLILFFLGPTLLYIAFSNREKSLYLLLLISGIIVSFFAIYIAFKGLKTIADSMFKTSQ